MRICIRVLVCLTVMIALTNTASAQGRGRFSVPAARVSEPGPSLPPAASPRAALQQLLRAQRRDEVTIDSVVESSRAPGRNGTTHARFGQRAGGLIVHGTYARVALDAQGQIVQVVENLATVPRNVTRARITAPEAIAAAIANLYPAFRA